MYQLLLIFKYLTRKIAPMFATMAVCLCSAMVIIVMSIMGGFLTTMEQSLQKLDSDVTVSGGMWGIEHHRELAEQLEQLDEVKAATAVIRTMGMIKLDDPKPVEVYGIEPNGYDKVFDFNDLLYWDGEQLAGANLIRESDQGELKPGARLEFPKSWPVAEKYQPTVIGIHVNPTSYRDSQGQYNVRNSGVTRIATLTVFPTQKGGTFIEPVVGRLAVVNEFKSGLYEIDKNRIFVPFDMLQKMLMMDSASKVDPETGEVTDEQTPDRANYVMVRGVEGVELSTLKAAVEKQVKAFEKQYPEMRYSLFTYTWREMQAGFLGAVENEKAMVSFLFMFISVVAFVMIAVVFYMIVKDKTRDIGTLRAIGASRVGIANIFLGYGLIVGIIGSLLGLWLAYEIVMNINEIQEWLADGVGVTIYYAGLTVGGGLLGALLGAIVGLIKGRPMPWLWSSILALAVLGLVIAFVSLQVNDELAATLNGNIRFSMWNPQTYYFDRIPARLNATEICILIPVYIVASVLGALIPAFAAARIKPVEALRYE